MKSVLHFELEGELVTLTRYDDFGNTIGIEEAMYPDICMEGAYLLYDGDI